MGCNTSKEPTVPNDSEQGENKKNEELTKDTPSSSAKTIILKSSANESVTTEEKAATKIQAVFRGHKTRKSMKQPQNQQEQAREPTREELENEFRLDDAELCNAATKIQASFRGHMSRKTLEGDKKGESSKDDKKDEEEELDIDLTDPELNKAAVKIQATFRGHLNRKEGEGSSTK